MDDCIYTKKLSINNLFSFLKLFFHYIDYLKATIFILTKNIIMISY
jgi:hypothetical protein